MSSTHVADTGLFVAMGKAQNRRYQAVERFVRRNELTFVLPERVYDELTVESSKKWTPPVDSAIEAGWAQIAKPLDYTNPVVSRTMDGVQRYIANADDRPTDEIERADLTLAGVAAQALVEERATQAHVYRTDRLAGEGAETILASDGFDDAVTYVDGFRLVEDLLE